MKIGIIDYGISLFKYFSNTLLRNSDNNNTLQKKREVDKKYSQPLRKEKKNECIKPV